jgi:phage shock protein E
MRRLLGFLIALVPAAYADTGNALIDYDGFARSVAEVRQLREARRIPEAQFMRMAAEPGTVVLDARSERLFRLRHVKGAVNLSFPEFTEETLARSIPAKDTRVLIYCNNNFTGAPESMPTKAVSSALNLSTFVSLHAYGYRNVYELGPAVDVAKAKVIFEGDEIGSPPTRGWPQR